MAREIQIDLSNQETLNQSTSGQVTLRELYNAALFFQAVSLGDCERCKNILIERDLNLVHYADEYGCTALMKAAHYNRINVVRLLILFGADMNMQDNLGNSVLHWACRGNSFDIVWLLLCYGVDPFVTNNQEETPLMVATKNGYLEVSKLLIDLKIPRGLKKWIREKRREAATRRLAAHYDRMEAMASEETNM